MPVSAPAPAPAPTEHTPLVHRPVPPSPSNRFPRSASDIGPPPALNGDGNDDNNNDDDAHAAKARRPSPYHACVPLFLHVFAVSLAIVPLQQWMILYLCRRFPQQHQQLLPAAGQWLDLPVETAPPTSAFLPGLFHTPAVFSDADWPTCSANAAVQALAARWSMVLSLCTSTPALIAGPCFGALSDSWGRKFIIIMPIIGSALNFVSILSVSNLGLGLWALIVVHLIQGLMGSWSVIMTAALSYFADTTDAESRSRTFVFAEAFIFLAFALGPFLGGISPSVDYVFAISIALEIVTLLYSVFILPESLPAKTKARADRSRSRAALNRSNVGLRNPSTGEPSASASAPASSKSPWQIASNEIHTVFSGMARVFHVASNRTFVILVVVVCCTVASLSGRMNFFNYAAYRFGWDAYIEGKYMLTGSMSRILHMLVTFPLLGRAFKLMQASPDGKIRFELRLVQACLCVGAVATLALALAWESWMIFAIAGVDGFASLASPNIRSLLSRSVPEQSQGQLFSSVQFLEQIVSLIFGIVFPNIWAATVGTSMSNLFLIVSAVIYCCAASGLLFTRVDEVGGYVPLPDDESGGASSASVSEAASVRNSHGSEYHSVSSGDDERRQ
ncbi:major facilitator superfamily domain-containing protein [Entophlyctis helioformis]|nr:major facilitator superfamily domain-containing protein [Entophlyctis helioformis]